MVQRKGSTRVSEDAEELVHVPLQAILLADSFAQKFRPITLERPKVNFQTSLSFSLSLKRTRTNRFHYYCLYSIIAQTLITFDLGFEFHL